MNFWRGWIRYRKARERLTKARESFLAAHRNSPEYCHLCEDFDVTHSPNDHFPCAEYKSLLMKDILNHKQTIPVTYYQFWLVNKA